MHDFFSMLFQDFIVLVMLLMLMLFTLATHKMINGLTLMSNILIVTILLSMKFFIKNCLTSVNLMTWEKRFMIEWLCENEIDFVKYWAANEILKVYFAKYLLY
jgi:predicted membrane protein